MHKHVLCPPPPKKINKCFSMTPSPVWLMFEIAQALHIHEQIMETTHRPFKLQGEEVCNAKNCP